MASPRGSTHHAPRHCPDSGLRAWRRRALFNDALGSLLFAVALTAVLALAQSI